MKVTITILSNVGFLNYFNSKEVYAIKGFDTERKARNYCKKYNVTIFETLPENVGDFQYCD